MRSFTRAFEGGSVGATLGAAIGTVLLPGFGTAVGAGVGAGLGGLAAAIRDLKFHHGSAVVAESTHHMEAKAPGHAHAHGPVYKSPNAGLFSALAKLFSSGGGGGGGGGGHGGGDSHEPAHH